MAKSIMIQGTMSNVGKSIITAGLCRILHQDGVKVAPFKSQNMALNSYITREGLEMGRAQVMQAEAAGIEPLVRMNPVLLKPTTDTGSQVVVNGKPVGNMSAAQYFEYKSTLRPLIQEAYRALEAEYDVIVLEGAGSPAEINLRAQDLVNMGMAKMAKSPVLLVGDIDRGGIFASLYGTVALLEQEERAMVRGMIINKFRGDPDILRPGLAPLEEMTGLPVLGVVPHTPLDVDDEDSLCQRLEGMGTWGLVNIGVIRAPHIANFTDFNALQRLPDVGVRYVRSVQELGQPDLILLPGSKNTMEDLRWLRANGLEDAILQLAKGGTPILGICGGYQMLGQRLEDPDNVEGGGCQPGMGLLPVSTVFVGEKILTRSQATVMPQEGFFRCLSGASVPGYEIHMGRTVPTGAACYLAEKVPLEGGRTELEGACSGNVCGSYLHGFFDGDAAQRLAQALLAAKGLQPSAPMISAQEAKETQYNLLADTLRQALDIQEIKRIIERGL